ncbi:hypothetical protein ACSR9E_14825 [Citrobacter koseri]|uniref:hypothetical protein n=1 Tax=Citrobacter koseri TaxID=545 RepID=UPI0040418B84
MRALLPYLTLYKRHKWMLTLGIILAIVTLLASIGLLTLSGWFLSASAVVGVAGIYSFNYMLPAAGVRGAAITRTAGRYSSVWSAMTPPSAYCNICVFIRSASCCRSPPPVLPAIVRASC